MVSAALGDGSLAKAEAMLEAAAKQEQPKSAVLCVQEGKFQYLRAFGEAKPDSKFLIASINKPMSAAGVMWLVDRKKLSLAEPVSKYFPEFGQGDRKSIRVGHLLSHTSGLPDMLPENTELRKKHAPLDEYVRLGLKTPLLFAPGAKWGYSSTGILLATEIARRIDGRPIAKLLEDEIFRPLGMKNTVLGLGKFRLEDMVRSQTEYAPSDLGGAQGTSEWDWNSRYWRSLGAPWGGAHSTASDIAVFLRLFLEPKDGVLSRTTLERMVQNQNEAGVQPYGIGWSVGSRLGKGLSPQAFGHGGSTGTLCWGDPAKKRLFVLLTSLPDVVARKKIIQPVSEVVAQAESN